MEFFVFEEKDGGYGADAVFCDGVHVVLVVGVHVDFLEFDVFMAGFEFFKVGFEGLAGAAPSGGEFDDF